MEFGFALYSNFSTEQSILINELSDSLSNIFSKKSYGNDVKEMYVGIICVKPEFDQFFKKRRMKYDKGIKTKTVDRQDITSEDCLQYDIKFDYLRVGNLKGKELVDEIFNGLVQSIDDLKSFKKIKDFDFNSFELDIKSLK